MAAFFSFEKAFIHCAGCCAKVETIGSGKNIYAVYRPALPSSGVNCSLVAGPGFLFVNQPFQSFGAQAKCCFIGEKKEKKTISY